MMLTLSTVSRAIDPRSPLDDATDLGYLLFKHPDRVHHVTLPVGEVSVFFPEASTPRCTVALLLDVDPIGLVRHKRLGTPEAFVLGQYVNDRPYVASSLLAVALGKVFSTARSRRCDQRPDLPDTPLPLTIQVPVVPCRGGVPVARAFFEPLGWQVDATAIAVNPEIPEWGDSRYLQLRLSGTVCLADALNQLYVLLPVLDDAKHYWVTSDEVDKLIRSGSSWLANHPAQEQISTRYLAHRHRYVTDAVSRLAALDDAAPTSDRVDDPSSEPASRPRTLTEDRIAAVLTALHQHQVSTVVDLGCGEGQLMRRLAADRSFTKIIGADVSARQLNRAERALNLQEASDATRQRIQLLHTSLTYTDQRLQGCDAVVLMEVIEHIEPERHAAMHWSVWGVMAPRVIIVTTPQVEYNALYPGLARQGPGALRHPDHRFEWTQAEFQAWATSLTETYPYTVTFHEVGPSDPEFGAPTQMAVFVRAAPHTTSDQADASIREGHLP